MNTSTDNKKNRFIEYLKEIKKSGNRKAMAELRRSLSYEPGQYYRSYRYTENVDARGEDETNWGSEARALVGGLFALHGDDGNRGRINTSLGGVLGEFYHDRKESPSTEKRFLALLDSDEEQLHYRLRQVISLIKEYRLDWDMLYRDVLNWNHSDCFVQRKWARDFYRSHSQENESIDSE